MKRKLQIIITTSAISAFACSALAENATKPKTDGTDYSRQESTEKQRSDQLNDAAKASNQLNGAAKASELIGMEVMGLLDEELGNVEDLWVDMESGRVVLVTLSSGGFLGIGSSPTAVPPGALKHDTAKEVLHLNVDKAKLESSPKFDTDKWAQSSSSNDLAAVYRHYDEESSFISRTETGQYGHSNQMNQAADPRNYDQTWGQPGSNSSHQAMMSSEQLGKVQRSSQLIGMSVKNRQDETIGNVENIVFDLPSGRLVAVVISSGGFLNMGDELSAVPPTALRFSENRDGLQLDTTKEKLSSAPHFKANQWPDFAQKEQVRSVYSAYQAEPYFATNAKDADNTQRNTRDRNDQSLTPMDQGNSQADIGTTASIRREINAADNMSMNAKNVKIITKDGRVTLRGPVNSAEEKQLIGEIANRIARPANVDNQLEVNLTVSNN